MKSLLLPLAFLSVATMLVGLSSCQSSTVGYRLSRDARAQIRAAEKQAAAIQVLPEPQYEKSSYEYFLTHNTYPATLKIYRNKSLLSKAGRRSPIYICLKQQRGRLYVDGKIAADWPVSTGVSGRETPVGSFSVLEKKKSYASNNYGNIKDASGKIIKYNADATKDEIPEGGQWIGSPMPNWMRLTWDGVGMHTGKVKAGRRLSHGCIRTPGSMAAELFDITALGSSVKIVQNPESLYPGSVIEEEGRLYQESLKKKKDAENAVVELRRELINKAKKQQEAKAAARRS